MRGRWNQPPLSSSPCVKTEELAVASQGGNHTPPPTLSSSQSMVHGLLVVLESMLGVALYGCYNFVLGKNTVFVHGGPELTAP